MSRHFSYPKSVFTALAFLIILALGGCETLNTMMGDGSKPTARVRGASLQDFTLDTATLGFDVEVRNPYALDLPLVNLDYALASDGRSIFNGTAPLSGVIPARDSRTITLPAEIRFVDILGAMQTVRPGAVIPYSADLGLSVDAPGLGRISLPLNHAGELPIPAVPQIEITSIERDFSLMESKVDLELRVKNLNQFPMDLSVLDYAASIAGEEIASARINKSINFAADGGESTVQIPIRFSTASLGSSALSLLRGNSPDINLDGLMDFDTPFGMLKVPFNE